jgi:hypothetical protein
VAIHAYVHSERANSCPPSPNGKAWSDMLPSFVTFLRLREAMAGMGHRQTSTGSPRLASRLELRPLPSPSITRVQRYYEPLRHPSAPGLSLAGVRLIIPDLALGLPVLRALSLWTCRRHYPGAAAGCLPRSFHPAVSAFPGRVTGSACTSSFSRSHDVLRVARSHQSEDATVHFGS